MASSKITKTLKLHTKPQKTNYSTNFKSYIRRHHKNFKKLNRIDIENDKEMHLKIFQKLKKIPLKPSKTKFSKAIKKSYKVASNYKIEKTNWW